MSNLSDFILQGGNSAVPIGTVVDNPANVDIQLDNSFWSVCDGKVVDKINYPDLYNILKDKYYQPHFDEITTNINLENYYSNVISFFICNNYAFITLQSLDGLTRTLYRSSDLITWTSVRTLGASTSGIHVANNILYEVIQNQTTYKYDLYASIDSGTSWTKVTSYDAETKFEITYVTYVNNKYFILSRCGYESSNSRFIYYSNDGISFTKVTFTSTITNTSSMSELYHVAYNPYNGKYYFSIRSYTGSYTYDHFSSTNLSTFVQNETLPPLCQPLLWDYRGSFDPNYYPFQSPNTKIYNTKQVNNTLNIVSTFNSSWASSGNVIGNLSDKLYIIASGGNGSLYPCINNTKYIYQPSTSSAGLLLRQINIETLEVRICNINENQTLGNLLITIDTVVYDSARNFYFISYSHVNKRGFLISTDGINFYTTECNEKSLLNTTYSVFSSLPTSIFYFNNEIYFLRSNMIWQSNSQSSYYKIRIFKENKTIIDRDNQCYLPIRPFNSIKLL